MPCRSRSELRHVEVTRDGEEKEGSLKRLNLPVNSVPGHVRHHPQNYGVSGTSVFPQSGGPIPEVRRSEVDLLNLYVRPLNTPLGTSQLEGNGVDIGTISELYYLRQEGSSTRDEGGR